MLPQSQPVKKKKLLTFGGILILLFYTFQNFIPGVENLSFWAGLCITALVVIAAILLFLPELKRDVFLFFDNFGVYCRFFFPKFGVFFVIYYAVAFTLAVLIRDMAANQSLLLTVSLPLLAFSSLIYAPIVEEIIYRGFLRRLIENDRIFMLISALIFGIIHMLHPGQTLAQYLYIIEYAMLGGFLAWLYVKSDNICLAMLGHCCLNLVAFLPILFM